MSDKKIELIAQLLAKAESTTPAEAEALMEHAERLMIKYGIDQAIIDSKRASGSAKAEQIITERITFKGAYRLEMIALGAAVASGLGSLRVLQSTVGNKSATLHVIGFESDVHQAITLIQSLQVQSAVAVRAWWKINKVDFQFHRPYDQEAVRRSFVKGFGVGAGHRIAESRRTIVEEAGTGTELVLVSRDAKVQEHFDGIQTTANRSRGGKSSGAAFSGGVAAGRQANTGGQALGNRKGISA